MTIPARERVMQAALPLILERGLAAVRTEDICAAAGVSNGSLFHAFANKEAIAAAIYVSAIGSYQDALLAELVVERPARDTITGLVMAHWRWVGANEGEARFLFEMGRPDWNVAADGPTREMNARLEAAYAAWWRAAEARGEVAAIPLAAARAIVLGPSMMALRHWLRGGGRAPRTLARVFAEGAVRALVIK